MDSNLLQMDYFHGTEAEQFTFVRVPKILISHPVLKNLSTDAKLLYGMMLDRMSLSIKNNWIDEQNRVYIIYSLEDVKELLNCKDNKAIAVMKELDTKHGVGLIEKRRRGQGKTNIIYVKNFMKEEEEEAQESATQNFENPTSKEEAPQENHTQTWEKSSSRTVKNKVLEVGKTKSNNTKKNKTNTSDTESHLIYPDDQGGSMPKNESRKRDGLDRLSDYEKKSMVYPKMIKANIDYDSLMMIHESEQGKVEEIYALILDTVLSRSEEIYIAGEKRKTADVIRRFMDLRFAHIEYVLNCMEESVTPKKNIKAYLLAALYNAPMTIDNYYAAKVRTGMAEYAGNMGH